MSTSVISSVDAPTILEAGEQVLDPVTLPLEYAIVGMLDAVLGMWWDAGRNALIGQCMSEGSETVGSICKQEPGGR